MKLRHIATESGKTGCPTIFETDRGTFVVQGWKVTDPEAIAAMEKLGLPEHETAVEIPAALVERFKEIGATETLELSGDSRVASERVTQ